MRVIKAPIEEIKRLKKDVYLLILKSKYLAEKSWPGQFVHLKIGYPCTLRRPFSIHKVQGDKVYILFKVRGRGTALLSGYKKKDFLEMIGPLGKGFILKRQRAASSVKFLVAGGMGVAPLVFLAQKLEKSGVSSFQNSALIGARGKKELLAEEEFRRLGFKVVVATEDGSRGFPGTVIALLERRLRKFLSFPIEIYACGSQEMLYNLWETVNKFPNISCQISCEQFMGCGIGVCGGCVISTRKGYKKVCKDGPVFEIGEVFNS